MLRLWRWTFARLYVRSNRKWGPVDVPEWSASGAVAVVIFANLLVVATALGSLLGIGSSHRVGTAHIAIVFLIVLFLVHHNYVTKGGARSVIDRLTRQDTADTRREERRLWLYIAVSLALPFLVGYVVGYLERL